MWSDLFLLPVSGGRCSVPVIWYDCLSLTCCFVLELIFSRATQLYGLTLILSLTHSFTPTCFLPKNVALLMVCVLFLSIGQYVYLLHCSLCLYQSPVTVCLWPNCVLVLFCVVLSSPVLLYRPSTVHPVQSALLFTTTQFRGLFICFSINSLPFPSEIPQKQLILYQK